ncbi:hypothetical protein BV22DRAFT_1012614, partial [Leucogyrophana mollusca]
RLLRILISESAHLIWALRCARVIGGNTHTENAIRSRWTNSINKRLQADRSTATTIRRNPKFTSKVRYTWSSIIETSPPSTVNWVTNPEVLVGIILPRPSVDGGTQGVQRVPHIPQNAGGA